MPSATHTLGLGRANVAPDEEPYTHSTRELTDELAMSQQGPTPSEGAFQIANAHGLHSVFFMRGIDGSTRRIYINSATTQSEYISFETGTSSKNTEVSDPPDLSDAIVDLYNVRKIAEEDECVIPKEDTLPKAERVLRAMYRTDPRPYAVYPMPDGDIAIDAHSPHGAKLVIMCDPDGSARCLVYINDEFERREYDDPNIIPDSFIVEALHKTRGTPDTRYS